MLRLLVAYTTYDGHTTRIVERIASALRSDDRAVEVCDLARSQPQQPVREYDATIIGGPIHTGRHPRQLTQLVSENLETLNDRPSAFFSVSLSAAGDDEQQSDATRCLNQFLETTGWKPSETATIAGAVLYRSYGFFKRWMMKMIVKRAGSDDTDTSRNYAYTDWNAVDRFAANFAARLTERTSDRSASATA